MKLTRLGHAMYLLTSKKGKKYLIDPFYDMNPGCPETYMQEAELKSIDAVFLTHGHFDHTSGLKNITDVNPDVLVVAQYELAMILMQNGVKNVYPLNYGGSIQLDDVKASMVQAKHTSSYGETEGTPIYAGEPAGYVFDFHGDRTLYHSGDTAMMSDMKLIQDFYQPDVAILSCSGQFVMGPEEAAYVVKHLLDVQTVIPNHHFPSQEQAPRRDTLSNLLEAFPIVENMMGTDQKLKALLEPEKQVNVLIVDFGEEIEL
ncbi:MAG: metal-dependent hydrolase [Bacillaceae bacterium]|nr:metal-dependent hydrolase [Bacillaceae bacterium]